jgi:hypothetical protein
VPRVFGRASTRAGPHEPGEIVAEHGLYQHNLQASDRLQGAVTGSRPTSHAPQSRPRRLCNVRRRRWGGAERIRGGRACFVPCRAGLTRLLLLIGRGRYFGSIFNDGENAIREALLAREAGCGAGRAICVDSGLRGYELARVRPYQNTIRISLARTAKAAQPRGPTRHKTGPSTTYPLRPAPPPAPHVA